MYKQKGSNMATALPVSSVPSLHEYDKQNLSDQMNKKDLTLCVKNVPRHVKSEELKKILEKFGRVGNVMEHETNSSFPYRFVECYNKEAKSNILSGMRCHNTGYIVEEKKSSRSSTNSSFESGINEKEAGNATGNRILSTFQQIKARSSTETNDKYSRNRPNSDHNRILNSDRVESMVPISNNVSNGPISKLPTISPYSIASGQIYNCIFCGKSATMCCERCEEIYCSAECQDNDWRKHKYFCFKQPSLINIPNKDHLKNNDPKESIKINNPKESIKNNDLEEPIKNISQRLNPQNITHRKTVFNNDNSIKNFHNKDVHFDMNRNKKQSETDVHVANKTLVSSKNHDNLNSKNQNINFNKNQIGIEKNNATTNYTQQNKTVEKAPLPLSGQQVIMTHIQQLNCLYIRSNETLTNEDYLKTISFVNDSAENSKYLTSMPTAKVMVISQFEGGWYRALVLNPKDENNILIGYIDFGNSETKKLTELKEMHSDCYKFKRYPLCVQLKGVPNVNKEDISKKCLSYLQNIIDNLIQLKIKYDENNPLIELIEYQTNKSINEEIVHLLKSEEKPIENNEKSLFLKDVQYIKFPHGENKVIYIWDTSFIEAGFITCSLKENENEIENIFVKLEEYAAKDNSPYEPLESELCIVKAGTAWYRASCESVLENGRLELLIIDLGRICEESVNNVRKYPNFLKLPCFSNTCFIKGFQKAVNEEEIDMRAKSLLLDLFTLYDYITVPKIEIIGDETYIHLPPDIIKKIKDKKIFNFNDDE